MTIPASQDEATNDVDLEDHPQEPEEAQNTTVDAVAQEVVPTVSKPQDVRNSFLWVLENFSKRQERKILSDSCPVGDYNWRLLIFPHGNNQTEDLSLYLDVADGKSLPLGWYRTAKFVLKVVNHLDPNKSIQRDATHRFNAEESDWGFTSFAKLAVLRDPAQGFLVNDSLTFIADIVIPREITPWTYLNYDSKKETGFVGLKNQGATCYMNSLLQTLYHTNRFRMVVYAMPTETERNTSSIALALQRVFYRLQTYTQSVGTKELTRSFGWDAHDAFTQHDVQELNRVLCDNLEEKMKNTKVDKAIPQLFEGQVVNYIECINVDYKSKREESFYDLSLNVKGCKTIYDSFDKYVEVEELSGDNKYLAEGHGLQDAKKGVKFLKFPPALHLQLKRFEYDPQRDTMVKVNDKYEFFPTIDLDKYLSDDANRSIPNRYHLHSVLVHSGDLSGGHYYAFIKPSRTDPQWYKFDDERVTKATPLEAMDDNFGGEDDVQYGWGKKTGLHKRFSNAYMLVYIRDAEYDEIMAPISEADIPEHLRNRFEQERADEEQRKKERSEAHLYMSFKVAWEEDLRQHTHTDLVSWDALTPVKFLKDKTLRDLRAYLGQLKGIDPACIRLWSTTTRQNKTIRADVPYLAKEQDLLIQDLFKGPETPRLFAQQGIFNSQDEVVFPPYGDDNALLFIKFYDPTVPSLSYIGSTSLSKRSKLREILPIVYHAKGLPPTTPLLAFEEVRPAMVEDLDLNKSLEQSEIDSGDIICFQQPSTLSGNVTMPLAKQYYEYLLNRVEVRIHSLDKPRELQFTLELSRNMTYDDVTLRIAQHIQADPLKIRLTLPNGFNDLPKQTPQKRNTTMTVVEMLAGANGMTHDVLYYEKLDYSILELETKRLIKIPFVNLNLKAAEPEKMLSLLLPKDGTAADVIAAVKEQVPLETPSRQVRIVETWQHRVQRVVGPAEPIATMSETGFRAEEVPEEELRAGKDDRLLYVAHITRDQHIVIPHGVPFIMNVSPNETVRSVRDRIHVKLGVPDEEFAKWKLVLVIFSRAENLADDDVVLKRMTSISDYLGLEHADHTARAYKPTEKPVKIYN